MRAMVLNDGETFTGVAGCKIVDIPDDWDGDQDTIIKRVCEGDTEEGGEVLYEFVGHEPDVPVGATQDGYEKTMFEGHTAIRKQQ
jgi:hypothetical protein